MTQRSEETSGGWDLDAWSGAAMVFVAAGAVFAIGGNVVGIGMVVAGVAMLAGAWWQRRS